MNSRNPNRPRLLPFFGTLFFLIVFSARSSLSAEEPLVWKFAEGDEHHYGMTQHMNMAMKLGPAGALETSVMQKVTLVWKVDSVDDQGTASLTQEVHRVQMEMVGPGSTEMNYDTQSEEGPVGYGAMVDPAMKVLISTPFQLTMTARGEITSLSIPKKATIAIAGMPGADMIRVFQTEKAYQNTMQQMCLVLPQSSDLVPDYQWTTAHALPHPELGKITARMTYRYQGNRTLAGKILDDFVPKLELVFGERKEENPTQMKIKEQKTTGNILFNRTAGRLESSTLEHEMTLANGNIQPIEQTMVLKIELKRITPPQDESSIDERPIDGLPIDGLPID